MKFTHAIYTIYDEEYKVDISIDETTGEFSATLPNKMCKFLKKKNAYPVEDSSLVGIKTQIKQLIKIRENQLMSDHREKVIVYQTFYNGNFNYLAGTKKIPIKRDDLREGIDIGVGFTYKVLYKYTYKNRTIFKSTPKGRSTALLPYTIKGEYREVPWSKKRERFFKALELELRIVIERMDRVFRFQKKSHLADLMEKEKINILKKVA